MTSSNLRPRPLQRFNSESEQPIASIEALCKKYSNRILDLIPQQLLDKARDITLADMLESEITACETISWLLNVVRFTRYYELNNTPDTVSYTHLRAHETRGNLVCRLLLEKKKTTIQPTRHPVIEKNFEKELIT